MTALVDRTFALWRKFVDYYDAEGVRRGVAWLARHDLPDDEDDLLVPESP